MAIHPSRRSALKTNNDTGFGNDASSYGGRFINKNGSFNLRREGVGLLKRISLYQKLLSLSSGTFAVGILCFYLVVNFLFALAYLSCGIDQREGLKDGSSWHAVKEAYFFSTQTFTTVGYGSVNPVGDGANIIASFEALCG